MSLVELAEELLGTIFDQFRGTTDLKACSLVARFLVDPSQRRLFRSLSIFSKRPRSRRRAGGLIENIPNLCSLHMSPRIGSYVPNLTIHLEVGHQRRFTTLNAVLRKVRRLTWLTILAVDLSFPWESIPSTTISLLRDICVLSTLRSLSLTRLAGVHASFILQAASAVPAVSLSRSSGRDKSTPRPQGAATANIEELLELYMSADHELHRDRFLRHTNFHATLKHLEMSCLWHTLPSFPALRSPKVQSQFYGTHLPETLDLFLSELPAGAPLLQTLFLKVDPLSNPGSSWSAHVPMHPLFPPPASYGITTQWQCIQLSAHSHSSLHKEAVIYLLNAGLNSGCHWNVRCPPKSNPRNRGRIGMPNFRWLSALPRKEPCHSADLCEGYDPICRQEFLRLLFFDDITKLVLACSPVQ
ncbi:hypothetical protein DFH09DRAFT_1370017 [Mycena vulgaris]|nr:hypothetical protein DFH09DRAFT_1370017 [Mycena vulgaris]